jgi:nitroreductase
MGTYAETEPLREGKNADSVPGTHIFNTVTKVVLARHSTRAFLPSVVPRKLIEEVLEISQRAPSNSNLQPWRVVVVSETALRDLSDALLHAVNSGVKPNTEPIPEGYHHYRSDLGHLIYGPEGYAIPRSDRDGWLKAQSRNYTFFDAPVAMILCMDKSLAQVDVLSAGMYLQTLCLLFAERGVGTCAEASIAGYPEVVKKELELEDELMVLVGVALGYEDESNRLHKLKVTRDAWKQHVTFRV